jgi:hypothetical protein
MFLLYHSEGCNICELVLHECYINDLYTTTCSGMLGHQTDASRETKVNKEHDLQKETKNMPSPHFSGRRRSHQKREGRLGWLRGRSIVVDGVRNLDKKNLECFFAMLNWCRLTAYTQQQTTHYLHS